MADSGRSQRFGVAVMIALRGWSLRNDPSPDALIDEISEFVVRGLGFASLR